MRSVVVVFPASMCAMIPMLRVSFRGTCLAMVLPVFLSLPACVLLLNLLGCPDFRVVLISGQTSPTRGGFKAGGPGARHRATARGERDLPGELPAVVRERLVGLGHPVRVFLLLDRSAAVLGRVEELAGQPLAHRLLAAAVGRHDDPPHRE